MSGIRYSHDVRQTIRKRAGTKLTSDIALELGIEPTAVRKLAGVIGVSLRLVGENHNNAKLSNLQVEMINALTVSGFRPCEIHKAAFSHVHRNTVHAVVAAYNRKVR